LRSPFLAPRSRLTLQIIRIIRIRRCRRSRKFSSASKSDSAGQTGFTKTLLRNKITNDETSLPFDAGYTWGLVLQGIVKRKRRRKKKRNDAEADNGEKDEAEPDENLWWWSRMREEVVASARLPTIDQPVAEALCVLADLDTWHVGILSNNQAPCQSSPLPVGMSRLVSNMLESFAYVWRKYHSPAHVSSSVNRSICVLETRSRPLDERRHDESISVHRDLGGETEGIVAAKRGIGRDDDVRGRMRRQRQQFDQRSRSRCGRHTAFTRGGDHSFSGNSAAIWPRSRLDSLRFHDVSASLLILTSSNAEPDLGLASRVESISRARSTTKMNLFERELAFEPQREETRGT